MNEKPDYNTIELALINWGSAYLQKSPRKDWLWVDRSKIYENYRRGLKEEWDADLIIEGDLDKNFDEVLMYIVFPSDEVEMQFVLTWCEKQ